MNPFKTNTALYLAIVPLCACSELKMLCWDYFHCFRLLRLLDGAAFQNGLHRSFDTRITFFVIGARHGTVGRHGILLERGYVRCTWVEEFRLMPLAHFKRPAASD